jgi:hypothetical protein
MGLAQEQGTLMALEFKYGFAYLNPAPVLIRLCDLGPGYLAFFEPQFSVKQDNNLPNLIRECTF